MEYVLKIINFINNNKMIIYNKKIKSCYKKIPNYKIVFKI